MLRKIISLIRFILALVALQSGHAAFAQERPTIAISCCTDPADTGLAKELGEQLLIALAKTQRFAPVSRDFSTGPAPEAKVAARFALSGSISFADKRSGPDAAAQVLSSMMGMPLCVPDQYSVGVDVMLKDFVTGAVVYADSVRTTVKPPCSQAGEGAGFSLAIETLSRKAANDMAMHFYPVKVVTTRPGGTIVLDYGEAVLPVGTYLKVYGPDQTVVADGRSINLHGPFLARVRVVEADAQTARAAKDGRGRLKLPPGAIASIDEQQGPSDKPKGRKP